MNKELKIKFKTMNFSLKKPLTKMVTKNQKIILLVTLKLLKKLRKKNEYKFIIIK